ncbi:MAG: aldehyde oxidase, partial [Deltaproteobacteria bacterium]|nr:aldehyde oxidase [Deltaproteobacteria bacterium]
MAMDIIGTAAARVDGVAKVTGQAEYASDIAVAGMLCGKILRSPHPHARILSIDTSAAERIPGVRCVLTREDFRDRNPW